MAKIKKGDQVIVIAGKEKGKQGTVLSVSNDRVMVEGLNILYYGNLLLVSFGTSSGFKSSQ